MDRIEFEAAYRLRPAGAVAESLPSFRQWGNWGVEQLVYLASRGRR